MYVGSPETVARRIAQVVRALDLSRFHLHYAIGRIPHEQRMAMIDLFGREVIPRVRELLAATPEPDAILAGGRS
jgi:alkanesulfonate monooxygenase SsuD/methylene tetrahydromethanopterin reductase-like flavin-dependent oxidoreductase (luciferase family)